MDKAIYRHYLERPEAIAVSDGSQTFTYAELLAAAIHLALTLQTKGLGHEEPIGILLGPGIKQIVSQLAVVIVRGTCVPLDPTLPELRINGMLADVGVTRIIVDDEPPYELSEFQHIVFAEMKKRRVLDSNWNFNFSVGDLHRSHFLFTSGSLGKPKPVQIHARGIMHLANHTPVTPLLPSDRVAHFNNSGFDLSLFEIWVSLISGSTVVCISRGVATDARALQSFLFAQKGLRHVLMGGDVANVKAVRTVLEKGPPEHLWNTYGPTECITLVTMFEITLEETRKDRISLGAPVGQMQVYLLDENLKLITQPGQDGEICIAGPQQSPGYWNNPTENEEHFIEMSLDALGVTHHDNGNPNRCKTAKVQLYRTGDKGEWGKQGRILEFIGRIDNQIKHEGFRVELGEIKRALLAKDEVKSAAVFHQQSDSPDGMAALVAFVILQSDKSFDLDGLISFLKLRLPRYMIPNRIQAVSRFPLTANGKVNRRELLASHTLPNEKEVSNKITDSLVPIQINGTDRKSVIKQIWRDLLNIPHIRDNDDFVALGASSLQSAAFLGLLQRRLHETVSMRELHEHSRLSDLLHFLDKESNQTDAPDDTQLWTNDIDLVDDLELVPDWQAPDEGRVFITGVTGFVGAYLLHSLLHNPKVKEIACLVRTKSGLDPAQRIQKSLERYDLWPNDLSLIQKFLILVGDMSDESLGLGPEKFAWLTNWASVVFHLGAKVNFCESYREHHASNIVGTRNMLRMAAKGRRKGFHYMSSIDAFGPTGFILGTRTLEEDEPLQRHVQSLRYDLGYSQTQWVAEAMVRRMRDRGLPVIIYRPGFVVGHSETGASNPDDFISRFIVGCIQLGTYPKVAMRPEYVSVDYVVKAVMHISSSRKNYGRSYHLLAPDVRESVSIEETCRVLNNAGYDIKMIDYPTWVQHATDKQRPHGPLAPLMPMLEEKVLGRLSRWEASQYSPHFKTTNTVDALSDYTDIKYVPFSADMVKKFVAFWNRKGFYNV